MLIIKWVFNNSLLNSYYAIPSFFVETSIDNAPSIEVESPGVASTGNEYTNYIHTTAGVFLSLKVVL